MVCLCQDIHHNILVAHEILNSFSKIRITWIDGYLIRYKKGIDILDWKFSRQWFASLLLNGFTELWNTSPRVF